MDETQPSGGPTSSFTATSANGTSYAKSPAKAAKEFDTYFLSHAIRTMYEKIEPDTLFGGGLGEKIFRDFLLNGYAERMADRINIVGDVVQQQLVRLQGKKGGGQDGLSSPNEMGGNDGGSKRRINSMAKVMDSQGKVPLGVQEAICPNNIADDNTVKKRGQANMKPPKYGWTIEDMVRADGIDEVI